jgi:DUF4097 and DUF4098 domain-containing protein YvlB
MNRTKRSPIDVVGITLGVLVILIVIGSIVYIAQGRMFTAGWSFPDVHPRWQFPLDTGGGPVREENDQQVPGTFSEVEVRNISGTIEVVGGSASGVAVHSVKTAPFKNAAAGVHVDIHPEGGRLVVEEKHDSGFMMRAGSVSFRVTVPRGMKRIEAHSVSGSVTVRDIEPGVDQVLSSVSGSVSTTAARNLDASTTSGNVQFVFSGANLNARSISGSVDGDIRSLDKGGTARLSTISGSISVNAFAGLDARLSLRTLSGSVSCAFPVTITEQKRNKLEGKIGAGSANIEASSTSGSVTISKD